MAQKPKKPTQPSGAPAWQATNGTVIAGQAALDDLDLAASAAEAKWGAGRLRLLVGAELREKFDRQRYLLNQAVWHGGLEDVRREAARMANAWKALDRAASESGAQTLAADVWEIGLEDGTVAAIVKDNLAASQVDVRGRAVRVYTLTEVARLIKAFPEIVAAKAAFPGATVERIRRDIPDALDGIADTSAPLDDEIPF